MSKEVFFINEPSQFKPGVKIYPPKVKDVVACPDYGIYSRLLTYSQEEIEDEFVEAGQELDVYPTPIEFLLNNSYHHKEYEIKAKAAFQFFIHEEVSFLYEQKIIVIGNIEEVLKIETDSSFVCNRCLHRGDGWCTLTEKTQCKHPDFSKFCFRYRYWKKIKDREEKIK